MLIRDTQNLHLRIGVYDACEPLETRVKNTRLWWDSLLEMRIGYSISNETDEMRVAVRFSRESH